jgi:phospholipase/carboxylesterase
MKELSEPRMADTIKGPRLGAKSGQARQLVVFLHGYGADGKDLIEIGRQWRPWLPDAAFVAPNAPDPCAMSPMGRQWFALSNRRPEDALAADERWAGVVKARPALDAFIDAELAQLGLDESRLALVGFSQGTMMALHVGLRRAKPPAAIIGYSGLLVLPEGAEAKSIAPQIKSRPPVLLVHGDRDEVIPVQALLQATQDLAELEVPAEWHISSGIGHGIDQEGLRHGGEFLARRRF